MSAADPPLPAVGPGWVLLCGSGGGVTDALRQYAEHLAGALVAAGVPARVAAVPAPRERTRTAPRIADVVGPDDGAVVVQYNPFAFGHLGIAPGLIAQIARLRRDRPDLRIALMCHETVALTPGPAWFAVRQAHRAQLAALIRLSDTVVVSTGRWIPALRRLGARSAQRLPVGSNLPDRRGERSTARARLGVGGGLVVASFSTGHPSHDDGLLIASLSALVDRDPSVTVLTLGAGRSPLLTAFPGVREIAPGLLPAEDLATLLSASDLFVSPYVDGVSTRRGTVMAALQHGVAVVATTGESTDSDLAALLGPSGAPFRAGPAPFTAAVTRMASDGVLRRTHAAAGRMQYLEAYDWPVLAARLCTAFGIGPAGPTT